VLKVGERVFVAGRRIFDGDIRRHFVGQVEASTDSIIRVVGYSFIQTANDVFEKKPEKRTRIFPLSEGIYIINVIPQETLLQNVTYTVINDRLFITDGHTFKYDVEEFRKI
jgi:hypothetical protein